jgi:superfamily II DNA or RNA helicase
MQLRPHQEKAIEMLRQSLRKGLNRPILAAPCSFGKTILAAFIANEAVKKGKRVAFVCDRIKLVQQALEKFDELGLQVGIMQGQHMRTDWQKPIQICSVQTLSRMRNRGQMDFDLIIVDECHIMYKWLMDKMERWSKVPIIGLSATPYSKGLGKYYNDLIVPITPQQLMDQGYLTKVDYYGGSKIDTKGIKKVKVAGGFYDYDQKELGRRTEEAKEKLSGDIIQNWFKHAEGRQTIAFSPSIKHSKYLVELFNEHGVEAYHIDGYMKDEQRQELFEAHDDGEFQILSCSQLLSTGYDSPSTSCIIDCKPTNLANYVQIAGRIMRTAEGKENAIYLDHAGNCRKWGFAEAVVPDELDDGEKKYNEKSLTKEKKEPKVRPCPMCGAEMMGMRCKCGYEVPIKEQIETTKEELVKLNRDANKTVSVEDKTKFFSELLLYSKQKGYKKGWAANKYKERFGVFPNRIQPTQAWYVSEQTRRYLKHLNIKYAKSKKNESIQKHR